MSEELKPFQKVLVRQFPDSIWEANLFGRKSEGSPTYYCLDAFYRYCIPYEGNEHLLGTTGEPKLKLEFGDHVQVRDYGFADWINAVYIDADVVMGCACNAVAIIDNTPMLKAWKYCRHADW